MERPASKYILTIRCDKYNSRNLYNVLWKNSFSQQIFLKHLLYARLYSGHGGYSSDYMRQNP